MELIIRKAEVMKNIRRYVAENQETIEREYKISFPDTFYFMSLTSMSAWLQVYASKILKAKEARQCGQLKDMLRDFIYLNTEVELEHNQLVV